MHMSRLYIAAFAAATAAALSGCGSYVPSLPGVTPFKIEIQQGNFVSQEVVSKLELGMPKEQVRVLLGTPLINDIFHPDRWDYVYTRDDGKGKREQRKLAVFFVEGKLARLEGDVVPANTGQPVKAER